MAATRPASNRNHQVSDGPCPVMHSCGGCVWLGLPYRKQLMRKQRAMEELFCPLIERHGWSVGLDPIEGMGGRVGEGKLPAPRAFRYKAVTPFAPQGRGAIACGFFARGTHRIVEVPDCIVEAPGARSILNGVAEAAKACRIPAYDEDTRRGLLRYAVLRMGWKTDEAMLTIVTSRRELVRADALIDALQALDARITTIAQNVNPRVTNAILGSETHVLAGAGQLRDGLLGCSFDISPTAFYQTNPAQTEVLYRLAIEGMELDAGDTLLDAYCGSGTIGLCAAHEAAARGADVNLIGVERNAAGIADAQRNAALNGLEASSSFIAEDATAYMRRVAAAGARVDVVCLDPPRAGSTPACLEAVCALGPRRVVYVSCNPTTQARDIDQLASGGYRLVRLTPVDMFPHTEHVETVAVLER